MAERDDNKPSIPLFMPPANPVRGVGLLTAPIETNRALQSLGIDAIPATTGQVLDAAFEEAWTRNPTFSALRWVRRNRTHPNRRLEDGLEDGGRLLSPEEANERWGIEDHLSWSEPIPEEHAQELHDLKRAELRRQDIMGRASGGFWQGAASLGAGFAASVFDPLGLAVSLVPVVGQARYAAMLARAGGATGRAGVRLGVGAASGAVGAAALEPIVYGVARDEQADYDMTDSLLNVAFGAALGGGLHVVGGAVRDAFNPSRWRHPMEDRIKDVPHEVHEEATRHAVNDIADDVPVMSPEVAHRAYDEAQTAKAAETPPGAHDGAQTPNGGKGASRRAGWSRRGRGAPLVHAVFDGDGNRHLVRYEVVEADDLVTSNRDDLTVNPSYPPDLQPRERGRVASQAQIHGIASRLEPERLWVSAEAATGAPVIGSDRVVESGNGRVLALRRAYSAYPERATAYKAFLASQGFDVQGFRAPVLVRRRVTDLDADARQRFTVAAQKAGVLEFSATERAVVDARLLDDILPLYQSGDVNAAANARFREAFVGKLPQSDQGQMIDGAGRQFSADGMRRFRNALLARAFDDADLLARMLEAEDDGSRALSGALIDVAPEWARMRRAVAAGEIGSTVDATANVLEAVLAIRDARAADRPLDHLLTQADAFDVRSPATDRFLSAMIRGKRTASREAITDALRRYIDEAMKSHPDADLFGAPPASVDDLVKTIFGDNPGRVPPEGAAASRRVEEALREADAPPGGGPNSPGRGSAPEGDARLAADLEEADADLARLRRLQRIRDDEPELVELAELDAMVAARGEQRHVAAFCLSGVR